MAESDWLDPAALAASATHLAAADEAVEHAVTLEWARVRDEAGELHFDPRGAPSEVRRRIAARMIAALASEGDGSALRGRELDRLLADIEAGATTTLRGVLVSGGPSWRFRPAPRRSPERPA